MKRFIMICVLCLALAQFAHGNPIVIDPADELERELLRRPTEPEVVFVPVFIIWCALGGMMILAGINLKFFAAIPFYLSFVAIIFGVAHLFIYLWLIYLGYLVVRLFQKRSMRDPDCLLNFMFHALFFVTLILLDQGNTYWNYFQRSDLVDFGIMYVAFMFLGWLIFKRSRMKAAEFETVGRVINEPDRT